ncbi:serine endoprotease [Citrobacter amalonaticus]|nr:serine endoprotease [Citrobacter amalonaticus]
MTGVNSRAKLIGSDDQSDIALLQIQNASKLTQITIADSDKLARW